MQDTLDSIHILPRKSNPPTTLVSISFYTSPFCYQTACLRKPSPWICSIAFLIRNFVLCAFGPMRIQFRCCKAHGSGELGSKLPYLIIIPCIIAAIITIVIISFASDQTRPHWEEPFPILLGTMQRTHFPLRGAVELILVYLFLVLSTFSSMFIKFLPSCVCNWLVGLQSCQWLASSVWTDYLYPQHCR